MQSSQPIRTRWFYTVSLKYLYCSVVFIVLSSLSLNSLCKSCSILNFDPDTTNQNQMVLHSVSLISFLFGRLYRPIVYASCSILLLDSVPTNQNHMVLHSVSLVSLLLSRLYRPVVYARVVLLLSLIQSQPIRTR